LHAAVHSRKDRPGRTSVAPYLREAKDVVDALQQGKDLIAAPPVENLTIESSGPTSFPA
jgi:hypothetical protein